MSETFSLNGKTILVTGATSGIGKKCAIDLSASGAKLVVTGRDEARLNETMTLLHGDGNSFFVADLLEFDKFASIAESLPLLDGVVHSAGITGHLPAKFIGVNDISEIMQVNYMAPVLLTAALLRKKKIANKASIVFCRRSQQNTLTTVEHCTAVAKQQLKHTQGYLQLNLQQKEFDPIVFLLHLCGHLWLRIPEKQSATMCWRNLKK